MESLDLREHQAILSADRAASGKDVELITSEARRAEPTLASLIASPRGLRG